jgi:hypothetical protein
MTYAITSGWDDVQQVVAMLRFLEGRAATIFNEWINQGHFVKMDADVMWRKLEKRFCDPSEERQAARMDLSLRLQRSGEPIQAYEQVFMELAKRAELTEEEMVTQWIKNIEPHLAERCRTHTALRDLSFEEVVTIARRAVRQSTEAQQPQVALKRTVHAVSARPNDWLGEVNGVTLPEERPLSIQAITESVRKQLAQEMASKQHLEDTVGQLKREWSTFQVLQGQQDAKADIRGPPPQGLIKHGAQPPKLPAGICHRCGAQGHMAKECTWAGRCGYCGRERHQAPVCYERIRAEARAAEAQTVDK